MKNKSIYSKASIFICILSFPISFFYFYILRDILPNNFFFDNGTIRNAMKPGAPVTDYSVAGDFYEKIGFHWDTPMFYEILFSAIIFTIFVIGLVFTLQIDFSRIGTLSWIIVGLGFFGPFFSMISKDLIVFIYMLFTFFFFNKRYYPFILFSTVVIYAFNYREYWLITAVLTLFLWVVMSKVEKNRILKIILFIIFYMIAISIAYNIANGGYLSGSRAGVNEVRIDAANSRTMTKTILPPTNLFNDMANTVYNAINLLIPIDGFGSINELAYYFWLYAVLILIWFTYRKCKGITGNMLYYLLFFASFLFTQSLFEPDMGSAFRHQLPITLFIPFMLINYQDKHRKLE